MKSKTKIIVALVLLVTAVGLVNFANNTKVSAQNDVSVCPDGQRAKDCTGHENTTDPSKCRDGTSIPSSPHRTGGTEAVFCQDHKGYLDKAADPNAPPAEPERPPDTSTPPPPLAPGPSGLDVNNLPRPGTDTTGLIQTGLSVVFGILGAISLVIITLAGFKYVVSRGDPQGLAKAKGTIIYAVIGLVIAISAQIIVSFVIDRISP